jgi:hypothetical protein
MKHVIKNRAESTMSAMIPFIIAPMVSKPVEATTTIPTRVSKNSIMKNSEVLSMSKKYRAYFWSALGVGARDSEKDGTYPQS